MARLIAGTAILAVLLIVTLMFALNPIVALILGALSLFVPSQVHAAIFVCVTAAIFWIISVVKS